MMHNTDSPAGVAATSAPGLAYAAVAYLANQPIEKWVSALTGAFVFLQIVFLIKDRMRKRRDRRAKP